MHGKSHGLAAFAASLLLAACPESGAGQAVSQPPAALQSGVRAERHAAAWRRATRADLQRVSLPLSQILIRHAEAKQQDVSFYHAGWKIMPAPPARSRAEALAIATSLAEQARQDPSAFARLAELHSEDVPSRGRGGSLGSVTALYLLDWPQVLDALAAIQPGSVTAPVETEYGVHVFRLAAPPAPARVSGDRIVIGHDQAEFLEKLQRRDVFTRTREQGLALARDVYAQAVARPEQFAELARRYSEHPSIENGADFGEWSTREATDYPIQVDVLRQLAVGDVSPPFETLFGWEILRRTPERPRESYAMTAVEIPFTVSTRMRDDDPKSAASASKRAREYADILKAHPERFDELQRLGCCNHVTRWVEGRGPRGLAAALQPLQVGQIAPAPVRLGFSYLVPKRLEPAPAAEPDVRFDLSFAELSL